MRSATLLVGPLEHWTVRPLRARGPGPVVYRLPFDGRLAGGRSGRVQASPTMPLRPTINGRAEADDGVGASPAARSRFVTTAGELLGWQHGEALWPFSGTTLVGVTVTQAGRAARGYPSWGPSHRTARRDCGGLRSRSRSTRTRAIACRRRRIKSPWRHSTQWVLSHPLVFHSLDARGCTRRTSFWSRTRGRCRRRPPKPDR
jgi:hypothetical protein